MLYLNQTSFCRVEPRTSAGDVTTFSDGERFPIIGWNPEGWWLVQIDIPDSKYTSCWIYGNTPEGDYSSVRIYP
jgi:hypothetical protein